VEYYIKQLSESRDMMEKGFLEKEGKCRGVEHG
jgi:hypothetical protein